jgi:hypothetical protein
MNSYKTIRLTLPAAQVRIIVVTLTVLVGSVFVTGCGNNKRDVPATEAGRQSFMGDASKMPDSARQKMREAQQGGAAAARRGPQGAAPQAPAAPAPPGP